MSKNPTTIRIGGVPYSVSLVSNVDDVNTAGSGQVLGQFSQMPPEIRVFRSTSPELTTRAFLHEVFHGIVMAYGVRELNVDGQHLEIPIDQLATGIAEVLDSLDINILEKIK